MAATPWRSCRAADPQREFLVRENEATLQAFVHAAPHVDTMRRLIPHMGPTRFVRWTVLGTGIPISWDDALRR